MSTPHVEDVRAGRLFAGSAASRWREVLAPPLVALVTLVAALAAAWLGGLAVRRRP